MGPSVTKGKKILLVDDASVFLSLAGKMLERTGAQILSARNGVDAIKLVQTENPDVVVLDLLMPEMTGDKVCSMIKNDPATSDIPVIIVTSRGMPEELDRCRRAGCDDFLTKPVKQGLLFAKVSELLKASRRHSIRILVRIEREGGKEVHFGTSRDVSKTGIQIETAHSMALEEEVLLRFFLKSGENEISVVGKIVRKEKSDSGFAYGIQFLPLSPPQRRMFTGFLESRSGRG